MDRITFPLEPENRGTEVANLQDALQFMLDRRVFRLSEEELSRLRSGLESERGENQFGSSTLDLVRLFQESHGLELNGFVDRPTAAALNNELARLGAFEDLFQDKQRLVAGRVSDQAGAPLLDVRVRAFVSIHRGKVAVGESNTDAEGSYTISYNLPASIETINLHVEAYSAKGSMLGKSGLVQGAGSLEVLDVVVQLGDNTTFEVKGRVSSLSSASVSGLLVRIVDKGIGVDVPLVDTTTSENGSYRVTFTGAKLTERGKQKPDLQARVLRGEVFLAASEVRYNAGQHETLNVRLPEEETSLASEHETLTAALKSQFVGQLADLKENDEQQDITYLSNKSGWDARAVAMAALADQFSIQSRQANLEIEAPFFYALFRAGLPANQDTLFHTDRQTLETVWKKAAEQGVISQGALDQIPSLIERFQALSADKLLTGPAVVGPSSLKEMLSVAGLDDTQQQEFTRLYALHRTDMSEFWTAISNSMPDKAEQLQVQGKLAYLTINNVPLMQKAAAAAAPNGRFADPVQLAQAGYYREEAWKELLSADTPIPQEIPGEGETQKANYATYLAAQVRLSYPSAAIAHLITDDQPAAAEFLSEYQGKFEIGVQPVQQYIAQNNLQSDPERDTQLKRLDRLYQITPSDQALKGLLKRNIDSAYKVVRYEKETFIKNFADDLGGADQAALTYDKSVQVHNAVLNVALSYLTARTAPAIGVHSPPSVVNPVPANPGDIIAYATLESLFDSMDFCECEHCRSILSPAAYLVDLLLFLRSDEEAWADFCIKWRADHGGIPYPFPNQAAFDKAGQPTDTEVSPVNILLSRRPDIEQLPLTCENTNTALPYIDIVNEILEYFIANTSQANSLKDYQGHDTAGIASEDLMASPQYVFEGAYTTLANTYFPAPLPFHRSLENLRRYFDKFEVPLHLAMERLRQNDDLERGTRPYGWRDILMEELGLSRSEYEILINSATVPLGRMYGFPDGNADEVVIESLSNAKQFARRVGITYEDLITIVKTRFINPNGILIPKVERLGVSFAVLKALKDGTITDVDFDALLPTGLNAPDPVEYGGDIKAWVKNYDNYARIMSLITLATPLSIWTASKDYKEGECVLPTASPPESTLYFECTTAGISAATEPVWPLDPGNTYTDGTVIWTCRDTATCVSFDNLAFRYTDPSKMTQNLSAVEFVLLLRFIRLWEKLGWTIEQTDAAICALYREDLAPLEASDLNDLTKLDTGFLTFLPRLGIVVRVLRALDLTVKRDLLPLLACWSNIGTYGNNALYRQMFLNPALLRQDAVFADNGYGEFLTNIDEKLLAHAETLRSAFNLTGIEFDLIIESLGLQTMVDVAYAHPQPSLEQSILNAGPGIGYDDQNKKLSYTGYLSISIRDALKAVTGVTPEFQTAIDTLYGANQAALKPLALTDISAIFRRSWLARVLKLSVRELLLLIKLTSLDPFMSPNLTDPAILNLISLVQTLRDRSMKLAAALYLIWNQDLSGKSVPDPAQVTSFARTLRLALAAVETEFAVADDPDGTIARARMAMVYEADAAAFFFGLLNDTLTVAVSFSDPEKQFEPGPIRTAIEGAAGQTETGVPKIAYDDFRKQLSYSGVLTSAIRDAIKSAADAGAATFLTALGELYKKNQAVINPFFARYPELQDAYNDYISDPSQSSAEKRTNLLKAILPDLIKRRKRQQVLQTVSTAADTELSFAEILLGSPAAPFPLHAAGLTDQPALSDFLALEVQGLTAEFFASDTATGTVILPPNAPELVSKLDYKPIVDGVGYPLPTNPTPGGAISTFWRGYLEAPENGFFTVRITADAGARVTLVLDGKPVDLAENTTLWNNTTPIELKAGTLHSLVLTIENVRDVIRVEWDWDPKGQGRAVIPATYLYPATAFDAFQATYIRFLKVASLAAELGLTANEVVYFATHTDYQINMDGWLNALTVDGTPELVTASKLLKPFFDILEFVLIKTEISPGDESLLVVLKDPASATKTTESLLFTITHWSQTSLREVLAHFSTDITGLGNFGKFRRVYDAFALIQQMGITGSALIQATTNEPANEIVQGLQAALRARHTAADWREVVRPINDEMRSLQRDALVAYILHEMRSHPESAHIDTSNKLFEYFLVDVEMDACMPTSRIRHALSSIQLFVERCFMNLEPRVSPAALDPRRWEWMKRYRVWEANRKVYLYPENWLESELRDDKSPFFKEVESELLQSDITEDSAAIALLNYLSNLEDVAKLEPCGFFHIPADPVLHTGEVHHVVARTAGARRKYYYRRFEFGYWTPWEPIKLDIEDNPVALVVWKNRLLLFWLRILKEPVPKEKTFEDGPVTGIKTSEIETKPPNVLAKAILCWSENYNGKWQQPKTSDPERPLGYGFGHDSFSRSSRRLSAIEEGDSLLIVVNILTGAYFRLYNTYSATAMPDSIPALRLMSGKNRSYDPSDKTFALRYTVVDLNTGFDESSFLRTVLSNPNQLSFKFVEPNHRQVDPWQAPFLLDDDLHTYLVRTKYGTIRVPDFGGFGVLGNGQILETAYLSKLIQPLPPASSKLADSVASSLVNQGVLDLASIRQLVTEDGYIHLETSLNVRYGNREIGPLGAIANGKNAE